MNITKTLLAATALVAAATAAPSMAATTTFPVGSLNFQASPGGDGSYTGALLRVGIAAGDFTDLFTFTLPTSGFGSGTVTTSVNSFMSLGDLDFTSVLINGTEATITRSPQGLNEVAFANNVQIFGGQLNTLTVNGVSRGNGSYGGQLSFTPGAVPEPATWGMMILGFGMVGGAMRRRTTVAFKHA